LYVIYRALPGGSDRIVLYYRLMATWTGLGDNTELFWAVLSQRQRDQAARFVRKRRRGMVGNNAACGSRLERVPVGAGVSAEEKASGLRVTGERRTDEIKRRGRR
jgi:hypothetical protein